MKRAAILVLLCAFPSLGYVRSRNSAGFCTYWKARQHSFQIDAQGTPDVTGTAAFDAIRQSFATWQAVSCSDFAFPEESLSTDSANRLVGYFTGAGVTNHNLVLFRTKACAQVVPAGDPCLKQGGCGNAYDCWDFGSSTIATTTTTSNNQTGEIVDSDIELNNAGYTFTANDGLPCTSSTETGCVRTDVQNTVTHEAGHTIGLDHSPDPNATMYATAPQGQVSKRVLGTDDVQGICEIYPTGGPTLTTGPNCAQAPADQGGCGCSHSQTGPGAALGALLLLLQISRRSRSRPQLAISSSTAHATSARSQSGSEN